MKYLSITLRVVNEFMFLGVEDRRALEVDKFSFIFNSTTPSGIPLVCRHKVLAAIGPQLCMSRVVFNSCPSSIT